MWDFLSKVVIHLIDKVSFAMLALFVLLFGVFWFFLPYEMLAFYVAPRLLPVPLYYGLLFALAVFGALLWRRLALFVVPRFKRWRAFRAWQAVFDRLSCEERIVVQQVWQANGVPVALPNSSATLSLTAFGVICLVRVNAVANKFYLFNPAFRAFLVSRVQQGRADFVAVVR